MRKQKQIWQILRRSSPGFTLVEVVTALAILSVLGAVGIFALETAVHAVSTSLVEARWSMTVLQLDTVLRKGIGELPASFWGPSPTVRRTNDGYVIEQRSDGKTLEVRFSHTEGLLMIATPTITAVFRDIVSIDAKPVKTSDGRWGGVAVKIAGSNHIQRFVVGWNGQRL